MRSLDRPWVSQGAQSPNRSSRLGAPVDCIVLHYTAGGSHAGTVSWFANPAAQASAHFVVGRDGEIIQCVPLDLRAWHVGRGRLPVGGKVVTSAVDRSAVGIEIANHGLVTRGDDDVFYYEVGRGLKRYDSAKYGDPVPARLNFISAQAPDVYGWWEPYSAVQVAAVVELCRALREEFEIPPERILGHEDCAYPVGRKTDPGPLWPWISFMNAVVGAPLPATTWSLRATQVV